MNTPADLSLKAEISLEDKITTTTITTETTGMATTIAMETETIDIIITHHNNSKPITISQELVIVAPGPRLNQLATKMRN